MKTEIIDTIEVENDFMIYNALAIDNNLVILKSKLARSSPFRDTTLIDIKGDISRTIDVSEISENRNVGIHENTIFPYKNGFGLIIHYKAELMLWEELDANPIYVKIEHKEAETGLKLSDDYIVHCSYDYTSDEIIIGIRPNNSPRVLSRYWAKLNFDKDHTSPERISASWNKFHQLDLNKYPETYQKKIRSTLEEWLLIRNILLKDNKKYIITQGGRYSTSRSGPEFEFHILSLLDEKNNVIKNVELDFGKGKFSANKKYFVIRPKNRKTLLVYNLDTLEVVFKIPLKEESNMGTIPMKFQASGELNNDLLYIYNFNMLNVCKLLK